VSIREYAKSVGFEVVGKLTLQCKWDLSTRCYADEAGNIFLKDIVIGTIKIIPKRRHTMSSEAQRKAVQKYKAKVKRLTLDFSPAESELYEHIQQQPNKQGYIKSLIRADMEKAEH